MPTGDRASKLEPAWAAARREKGTCRQSIGFLGARQEMNEHFKAFFNGGVVAGNVLSQVDVRRTICPINLNYN